MLLNKPTLLTRFHPLRNWLNDSYKATLDEFKTMVVELTFVVWGCFFVLLGYWTKIAGLLSPAAWLAALLSLPVIYLVRYGLLRKMDRPHPLCNHFVRSPSAVS